MNSYQTFKSGPRAGQPRTLHDRVVRYLVEVLKAKEVQIKSKKYRAFSIGGEDRYFVGKYGAVRVGLTLTDSISITERIHQETGRFERLSQQCVDNCNQTIERQELETAEADGLINNLDGVIH